MATTLMGSTGRACPARLAGLGSNARAITAPVTTLPAPGLPRRRCQTRRTTTIVAAKKKGGTKGGKKGGQKKGPGSLMDVAKPKQPFENVEVVMLNLLMVESFKRNAGSPLLEDVDITSAAKTLFEADFAIISCDRGLSAEPQINYVNKAALELMGKPWEELKGSPAADYINLEAEDLTKAQEDGSLAGYSGSLETASGTVTITEGTVWTIESPATAGGQEGDDGVEFVAMRGKVMGQGVVFKTWNLADGTPSGVGMTPVVLPTAEEVEELEKAIADQGTAIRELKESGLTNQDAEVADAVAVLLEKKQQLADWQELLAGAEA